VAVVVRRRGLTQLLTLDDIGVLIVQLPSHRKGPLARHCIAWQVRGGTCEINVDPLDGPVGRCRADWPS